MGITGVMRKAYPNLVIGVACPSKAESHKWADRLGVSLEVLLKRLLTAAAIGQVYVEKIPEI